MEVHLESPYHYVTLLKVLYSIHSIPCLQKADKRVLVLPSCAVKISSPRLFARYHPKTPTLKNH